MKTTELHEIHLAPQIALTDEANLSRLFNAEQARLGSLLGLSSQAAMSAKRLRKLKSPIILTQPLSERERAIWTDFFPRIYSDLAYREEELREPARQLGSLGDYDRAVIPARILCQMREWQTANVFDVFEIRAQAIYHTAALFGYRDGRIWLLARWSEDDKPLISFKEVKWIVGGWVRHDRRVQAVFSAFLGIFGLIGIWGIHLQDDWGGRIVLGIMSLFATFVAVGVWYDEAAFPSKNLMQAVRDSNSG
jgi:hypothetical protein